MPQPITRPARPTFDMAPAFSADGRHLAYVSCDSAGVFLPWLVPEQCAVRVIDVDDGATPTTEARTLATPPPEPTGVASSRDGQSIRVHRRRSWSRAPLATPGRRDAPTRACRDRR